MDSNLTVLTPLTRFSNRAENYARYRPSYPEAIVPFLEEQLGLKTGQRIADIGSGTGLLSELLLKRGYSVVCIEPNDEMRKAGEKRLSHYLGFSSRGRKAESTGLKSHSLDLVTVAQAFHWMEPVATKKEFTRILKPGGHIVLGWNMRQKNTAFLEEYENLKINFGIDYNPINRVNEETIKEFFYPHTTAVKSFPNIQWLDFDSLKGQLLSSSYIPLPGHPSYDTMISTLVSLFVQHNENGFVKMEYQTKLYWNKQG